MNMVYCNGRVSKERSGAKSLQLRDEPVCTVHSSIQIQYEDCIMFLSVVIPGRGAVPKAGLRQGMGGRAGAASGHNCPEIPHLYGPESVGGAVVADCERRIQPRHRGQHAFLRGDLDGRYHLQDDPGTVP